MRSAVFDSELDVLCAVIRHMPDFIKRQNVAGRVEWLIWNETTAGENFAERWNAKPACAKAFFDWHAAAMADLERLMQSEGLDSLSEILAKSFGQAPTSEVMQELFDGMAVARRTGNLSLAPQVGLTIGPAYRATPVRSNTFHGAP